jgi:hypothetical protein
VPYNSLDELWSFHHVPGAEIGKGSLRRRRADRDRLTKNLGKGHSPELKAFRYLNYWIDEKAGKVFCLVDAPDAETAHTVHREAHGLVADEIYPVEQG